MRLTFNLKQALLIASSLAIFSCSSDSSEDILKTPTDGDKPTEAATIRVTEGGADDDKFEAMVSGKVGTTAKGRVILKGDKKTQRRLYVTKQMPGEAAEPFIIPELNKKATKKDGSIDLSKESKNEVDFTFDLDVPSDTNGKIVYQFWTTSGKGDFRDAAKRKVAGVGTIIVSVGTGVDPAAKVLDFKVVKLFAPDKFGKTQTFFSLLNGQAYRIDVGPEFRAFWDFGYYYTNGETASLVSTNQFETAFPFPVEGLKPEVGEEDAANETLNEAFFAKSTLTAAEFDSVTMAGDLSSITKSTVQKINELDEGDVIEFVDNYGKKGLIKVNQVKPGDGNEDFISIDIKVQP